ncbi:MAG: hypothetical protein U1F36_17280 [Planctomycetota bacterium]
MTALTLSSVRFTRGSDQDVRAGLLGFVEFTIGERLRIDGVTVRRTRDGRLALSFPARRDRAGVDHPFIRPIDDATRRLLESAVFEALGIEPNGGRDGS